MPSLRDRPPGPALREITVWERDSRQELKAGQKRQAGGKGWLPPEPYLVVLRCAWILPQFPQPWGKWQLTQAPSFCLPPGFWGRRVGNQAMETKSCLG